MFSPNSEIRKRREEDNLILCIFSYLYFRVFCLQDSEKEDQHIGGKDKLQNHAEKSPRVVGFTNEAALVIDADEQVSVL